MITRDTTRRQVGNPAELVLNNLRLRLSALEASTTRARLAGNRNEETVTDDSVGASASLQLETRLAKIQQMLESKPSLAGPAMECAKKLRFITRERKTWLQTGNPAGVELDAALDADAPSLSSADKLSSNPAAGHKATTATNAASNDLVSLLLHYTRDEYLRDLATLRVFALSRDGSDLCTEWKTITPNILSSFPSSNFLLAPTSVTTGNDATNTNSGGDVYRLLEHDVTFQVDGETKTLDDLAALLSENKTRLAHLEERWSRLHRTFEDGVEWLNRSLCELDMSLEISEQEAALSLGGEELRVPG